MYTTGSKTKYPLVLVHGFIGFDNILQLPPRSDSGAA